MKLRLLLHRNFELLCTFRDIENTYEGTYNLRGSSKIHLRDRPNQKILAVFS